jgi:hypothetical protein
LNTASLVGLQNATFVQYEDLVAEQRRFVRVMGDDDHGCFDFALQLSQFFPKPAA